MEQYVGLDVSQKETAICVVDGEGQRMWQGTCRSTPDGIAAVLRTKAPFVVKVAMETGPLAVWHWHELNKLGVPIVCIHARHAKPRSRCKSTKPTRTTHSDWRRSCEQDGTGLWR
jgi:transposase